MTEITKDRACTLVGRFMRVWAFAEQQLNEVIATALKITIVESFVISANISLRQKWNILGSLVSITQFNKDDRNKLLKSMNNDFYRLSNVRHIMAHCMFFPSEDGTTVAFLRFAADGKLKPAKSDKKENQAIIHWSENELLNFEKETENFTNNLHKLDSKLKATQHLPTHVICQVFDGLLQNHPSADMIHTLMKNT